jgi:hypothetical protein
MTLAELKAKRDAAHNAYRQSMAAYSCFDESSIARHNANVEAYNKAQQAYRSAYLGSLTLAQIAAAV